MNRADTPDVAGTQHIEGGENAEQNQVDDREHVDPGIQQMQSRKDDRIDDDSDPLRAAPGNRHHKVSPAENLLLHPLDQKEEGIKQGKEEGIRQGKEEGLKQGKEEGIREGIMEGRKEGKKEGTRLGENRKLVSIICKKLRKAQTPEIIADALEEQISVVQEICEKIKSLAPDYDEKKAYRLAFPKG